VRGSFSGGEWKETCEHWVGFDDLDRRISPHYLLTQGETFDRFHDLMKAVDRLIPVEWASFVDSAPRDLAQLIDNATRHASADDSLNEIRGAGYWKRFVDHKKKYVTQQADDSYGSLRSQVYFVSDPKAATARLESLVERAIRLLESRTQLPVYANEIVRKDNNLYERLNDSKTTENQDTDSAQCPICKMEYNEQGDGVCEHFLSSPKTSVIY
jgi:hypothetical protein